MEKNLIFTTKNLGLFQKLPKRILNYVLAAAFIIIGVIGVVEGNDNQIFIEGMASGKEKTEFVISCVCLGAGLGFFITSMRNSKNTYIEIYEDIIEGVGYINEQHTSSKFTIRRETIRCINWGKMKIENDSFRGICIYAEDSNTYKLELSRKGAEKLGEYLEVNI